jgi:preprotein translocase subunit SecG
MSVVLGIFTFVLVLISVFLVLVILAQRAKTDGGMGAALGGGMAEAAFGGESSNVLQKITTWAAVGFFVLCFGLYLGYLAVSKNAVVESEDALPSTPGLIQAPDTTPGFGPDAQEAAAAAMEAMGEVPSDSSITVDLPAASGEPEETAEPAESENP